MIILPGETVGNKIIFQQMQGVMNMKKVIALFMSVLMMSSSMPVMAAGATNLPVVPETREMEVEMDLAQPRAMYDLSLSDVVSYGENKVRATFTVTVRDETANSSGFYITGIKGVSIKNVSGWYSVKSTGSIKSISYTNNHQQATVDITYQASAGAGNNTYSGTAKISVY